MTSNNAEPMPEWAEWMEWPGSTETTSVEELARQQGVRPIKSLDELALPGAFESEEEWQEFLADLYASRRQGMA